MNLSELRDKDTGQLPAFAWPGGYPIVYYTRDGLMVCPTCANRDVDSHQEVRDADVYWEGPTVPCDDCGQEIESAYGNPDAPEED